MNKYNQLREEIIKAVPEIMELKFGCEYKNIHGSIHSFINNAGREQHRYLIIKSDNGMVNCYGQTLNIFIEKILGRPITLEDCLIAIEKIKLEMKITNPDSVNYGEIVDITDEEKTRIMLEWSLNKPLQDQSDECKELLWDLICKK